LRHISAISVKIAFAITAHIFEDVWVNLFNFAALVGTLNSFNNLLSALWRGLGSLAAPPAAVGKTFPDPIPAVFADSATFLSSMAKTWTVLDRASPCGFFSTPPQVPPAFITHCN
jgi:hypothetical protein